MMLPIAGLFVGMLLMYLLFVFTRKKKPAAAVQSDSPPPPPPDDEGDEVVTGDVDPESEPGASAGGEAYSATDNYEELMLNTRDPVGWSVDDHTLVSNNQSGRVLLPPRRRICITRC